MCMFQAGVSTTKLWWRHNFRQVPITAYICLLYTSISRKKSHGTQKQEKISLLMNTGLNEELTVPQ